MRYLLPFLIGLSLLFNYSFGQYPQPQQPPRFLNNFSAEPILSAEEQAAIEQRLDQFEQETSNEITIIIVDDINEDEPWHYATEIGEAWKVGKADKDNGLVFLIKPTQENGGRQVYLAPGRGLEASITDLVCQDIISHEILPNFKAGNYAQGINQALDVLFSLAKGEYNEKTYRDRLQKDNWKGGILSLVIIIAIIALLIKKGGGGGTTFGGRRTGGPGFFYFGGGGFGGGSSGGGGFGGGGFGGFGGGSFGGGGSGGSW
ncbi:MAG: TPM domain-containing protein [Flavobacteriales bacterium]